MRVSTERPLSEVRVQQTTRLSQISAVPPPACLLSWFYLDDEWSPEMKVLHISHLDSVYHKWWFIYLLCIRCIFKNASGEKVKRRIKTATELAVSFMFQSFLKKHPCRKVRDFITEFCSGNPPITQDELGRMKNTFSCKAVCANDYYSF